MVNYLYENDEDVRDRVRSGFQSFVDDDETMELLSSIFKVLGDPTRLKIIYALSMTDLCVNDIAELLDMSQSSISHQLSLLKKKKLIKSVKDGRRSIYSLDDEHVLSLFNEGYDHAKHRKDSV